MVSKDKEPNILAEEMDEILTEARLLVDGKSVGSSLTEESGKEEPKGET